MIWWEQLHIFIIHLILAICRGTYMYGFVLVAIALQHISFLCLPPWTVSGPGVVIETIQSGMTSVWGKQTL